MQQRAQHTRHTTERWDAIIGNYSVTPQVTHVLNVGEHGVVDNLGYSGQTMATQQGHGMTRSVTSESWK